eukprot:855969-Pyramimonas_sp.AAC.1
MPQVGPETPRGILATWAALRVLSWGHVRTPNGASFWAERICCARGSKGSRKRKIPKGFKRLPI